MKRLITLITIIITYNLSFSQAVTTITGSTYRQLFNGSFGGNFYCCGSTDAWTLTTGVKPFINITDNKGGNASVGTGTTTGVNQPAAYYIKGGSGIFDIDPNVFTISGDGNLYGTTTDNLTLGVNTPTPSSYGLGGGNVTTGTLATYDARYGFYMKLSSTGDGFWADASNPVAITTANPNFSIVVTNPTSLSGFVRFGFYTGGAIWPGTAFTREYAVPANSTNVFVATDLPAGNVGALSIKTSGLVGNITFDDLGLGLTPTTNATITSNVATGNVSQNQTGAFSIASDGDELYANNLSYVNYTVAGSTNLISIDKSTGTFTFSGLATGTVTVTAASVFVPSSAKTYVYTIQNVPVTSVSISSDVTTLTSDGFTIANITASILPANASNQNVTLTSSNVNIASLVGSQVVGNSFGVVTITGTAEGGLTSMVVITVLSSSVTGVSVSGAPSTLTIGGTATLSAATTPAFTVNNAVTWAVSSGAATLNTTTGLLTAVSAGVVTITATSVLTPTVKGIAVITILTNTTPVSSISVSGTSTLTVGGVTTLTSTVLPANATNKTVTYSSSSTIAGVNSTTGVVTAAAAGVVTITSTSVSTPSVKGTIVITITTVAGTTSGVNPTTPGTNISSGISSSEVSVYPNPATTNISASAGDAVVSTITIIDVTGSVVASASGSEVSVAGLTKGLYIIIIETNKGIVRKTISKE
ncbi:MAG: Ig-like domain-containing protein [Bacteroidota bacterium]|nr:Ig-like domain-containing protein [Bacteroidota bacterium]